MIKDQYAIDLTPRNNIFNNYKFVYLAISKLKNHEQTIRPSFSLSASFNNRPTDKHAAEFNTLT